MGFVDELKIRFGVPKTEHAFVWLRLPKIVFTQILRFSARTNFKKTAIDNENFIGFPVTISN